VLKAFESIRDLFNGLFKNKGEMWAVRSTGSEKFEFAAIFGGF
jgi:hypothetical protein